MTEKRFTYKGITATDIEVYDYNKVIGQFRHDMMTGNSLENMTNLMNALHEENQSLKFKLDECRNHKLFSRRELEKENEHLRNRINDWHQRTFKAHEYFNILEEVIEEVCDDDISNQIWKEYGKREKLIE